MNRDKILGLGLSGISLLAAILAGTYFIMNGESLPLAVFAAPALGFIVGAAIFFFSFVETSLGIDDEIEQFPKLVEDDLQKMKDRAFTFTHLLVALTLFAVVVEMGLLVWYRKEGASWGPLNVLFVAVVAAAVTLSLSLRAGWFQRRRHRLSPYTFAIPAIGWGLCILIAISFAEPKEFGGRSPMERSQTVTAVSSSVSSPPVRSRATFEVLEFSGDALSGFDCDDEGCLVILLIAVVVVVVIAAAFIPHFWVVATTLLLTLMAVIALREVLYHDDFT